MLFWNALWNDDHAITYLAHRRLSAAPRKALRALPGWVKNLGAVAVALAGVGLFFTMLDIGYREGPLAALMCPTIIAIYIVIFWGIYRAWTLGSLLSKLRDSDSQATFLNTPVSAGQTVDVLGARIFRQLAIYCALPFASIFGVMVLAGPRPTRGQDPFLFLILLIMGLGFYCLLGSYGILLVHTASQFGGGRRGIGYGFGLCMAYVYIPFLLVCVGSTVCRDAEDILFGLFTIYGLCLPLLFRRAAILELEREPRSGPPESGPSLRARFYGGLRSLAALLPRYTSKAWGRSVSDFNPVLGRSVSNLNLLPPLGLGVAMVWLCAQIGTQAHQGPPSWVVLHIVTWFTTVPLALMTLAMTYSATSTESSTGTLDILQTTPLSASQVIDSWALPALVANAVVAGALMAWAFPGRWYASALFALVLGVCAAYGGIVSGLKDMTGAWISRGLCLLIFFSWILVPAAYGVGTEQPYLVLTVVLGACAWYLRRRALLTYGG